jgi:hypothetical protein
MRGVVVGGEDSLSISREISSDAEFPGGNKLLEGIQKGKFLFVIQRTTFLEGHE